jgi:hypothetical protein
MVATACIPLRETQTEDDRMTADERPDQITQDDIDAFGQKLSAWSETLSPKERTILTGLVARASGEDALDVQGYTWPRDGFSFFYHPGVKLNTEGKPTIVGPVPPHLLEGPPPD